MKTVDRFQWQHKIASKSGPASSTLRLILLAISLHMTPSGDRAFPGIETVAQRTNLNPKTLRKQIDIAIKEGWLKRRRRPTTGKSWVYEYVPCLEGKELGSLPTVGKELGSLPTGEGREFGSKGREFGSEGREFGSEGRELNSASLNSNRPITDQNNRPEETGDFPVTVLIGDDVKIMPPGVSVHLWNQFVDFRQKLCGQMTDEAKRQQLNKLNRAAERRYNPVKIIQYAISNGMKDLATAVKFAQKTGVPL